VCNRCFGDETTCAAPRARVLRLGMGSRLRRVDPQGRLALVSGWHNLLRLYDLATGQRIDAPSRLPMLSPLVSSIARDGRVVWPIVYKTTSDKLPVFQGLHVGSVRDDSFGERWAQRPISPRELMLCPEGRYVWFRTAAETVALWDLEEREPDEYDPLPGSVLQAAALDTVTGLLATATYGRAAVHRVHRGEAVRLGTVRALRDADNVWLGLAGHCLVSVSDYRGLRGHVIRAFALDAAGVPEREPFYVYEETDAAAGARRKVRPQRPITASLSQDGRYLAMATEGHDVALHDLTRRRVRYLGGHTDVITTIAFTDGAQSLVTGDHDNRVLIRPRRDELFVDLVPGQPH
jgi:hypothetical protein